MKITILSIATALGLAAAPAFAESWTLDDSYSQLAFASVKNTYIGEVHRFDTLSGSVTEAGLVDVTIDLSSVETNIDIRNERMAEHVFNLIPTARLTAQIDMDSVTDLPVGDMMTTEIEAVLSFIGNEVDLYTNMTIVRLSEDRVMALTDDMVFLETDLIGVDAGIDVLQELASLDHITRAVPVTLRLVFNQ